jgi:hypothetical protein
VLSGLNCQAFVIEIICLSEAGIDMRLGCTGASRAIAGGAAALRKMIDF